MKRVLIVQIQFLNLSLVELDLAFKISLKNGFTSIWSFLIFNVIIVSFNGAIIRPTLGAVMKMGLELDMDLKRNSMVVQMLKLLGQVQLQGQPQSLQQQLQRNAIQLNRQLQQQQKQQQRQQSPLQNHQMTDFSVRINRMEFIPTNIAINSMNVSMAIPLQRTVLLDFTTIPPSKDVIGQLTPLHIIQTVTLLSNKLTSTTDSVG